MAKMKKAKAQGPTWPDQLSRDYQLFPLFLLEYCNKKEFKGNASAGVSGPFIMHCMGYLREIANLAGVDAAVREFSDQLGDRICGIDHPDESARKHRKIATDWLNSMLDAMKLHASRSSKAAAIQDVQILEAIRADMLSEIEGAYLDDDDVDLAP